MNSVQKSLLNNREQFLQLYRFNYNLLDYAKKEIVEEFFPNCPIEILYKNKYTKKVFSKMLLKKMDLEGKEYWDTENVLTKIALLEQSVIFQLIRLMGAAIYHLEIRKEIKRERVKNIIEFLGKTTYIFAMKRAVFFIKENDPLRNYLVNIVEKETEFNIESIGWEILNMAFWQEDIGLTKRLWLKIGSPFQPKESEFKERATKLVKRILTHEVLNGCLVYAS